MIGNYAEHLLIPIKKILLRNNAKFIKLIICVLIGWSWMKISHLMFL
ncbi:hypothetical protein NSB1T_07150 [Coprobacter fastidiosus NSB1 = JCM 33896]|nr:hypothetical protein NSB1T_07150 [Coprobacter fastidiosus NSB1 = JCM 33896]